MALPKHLSKRSRSLLLGGAEALLVGILLLLITIDLSEVPTAETVYFRSNPPLERFQMEFVLTEVQSYSGVQDAILVDNDRTLKVTFDPRYVESPLIRQTIECSRVEAGLLKVCLSENGFYPEFKQDL